jgi:hypothetical protein
MAERLGIIATIVMNECFSFKMAVVDKGEIMDKHTKLVIAILSIQLTISGIVISHLCFKLGYEQGRASVVSYGQTDKDGNVIGTCYVPGGCEEKVSLPHRHRG